MITKLMICWHILTSGKNERVVQFIENRLYTWPGDKHYVEDEALLAHINKSKIGKQ